MPSQVLFTPWRYRYISQAAAAGDDEPDCFFCQAGRRPDDPERLVVHLAEHHLVMLNRHPYSNGHLMVAPLAHHADPAQSPREAQAELWSLALLSRRVLQDIYRPDGLNLGMNLGRVAGAGVPGHHHLHVVPRWHGDTNFMTVVGDVRLVPEDLRESWTKLRARFAEVAGER